ncbi:MAG TPA: winged helix-turn-helix transcriptional regulator, partial [Spirochaetia bacterium]|nr:winged helix-turn-helix transcriptional regulator [Spirochaetia bacterium]
MDALDVRLLDLLQQDARMKISELSKRLNLSRPSVSERMARLQDAGIIEGYSARIS